ncbi:MAG: ATP-binding protein [Vicinamibacteria bacterium]
MLVNLLSNAVKFTETGAVGLEAARLDGRVRFVVSDTGVGIAAGDLPRLFRPFVQLGASLGRRYEGTGLGLALVRHLVEMHGGEVKVESERGRGTRVTVDLPA